MILTKRALAEWVIFGIVMGISITLIVIGLFLKLNAAEIVKYLGQ